MSISNEQLTILRRYVDEPDTSTYTDVDLNDIFTTFGSDLNLAAAEVWRDKAAKAASLVDESEGPSSLKLSQLYDRAVAQANFYDARSSTATATSRGRTTTRAIERA